MADSYQAVKKVDGQDTPDSTTKERINYFEGDDVLVLRKDGRFYLGTVVEVILSSEKCLIKFGDGTERWSVFKDLTRLSIPITDECLVACVVCKSTRAKRHNEVVSCEKCGRGYHQHCHQPVIESTNSDWICKRCRKNRNLQLSVNRVIQKTVSSTSKDCSLPQSYNDIPYDTANNVSETTPLPELPLTPPLSVSAPETPQPLIVNGEPPTSPTEDVSCIDFNDTSISNAVSIGNDSAIRSFTLDDLFADSKVSKSGIALPLSLNPVITDTLMRPTKRRLSEKDIRINRNGEIKRRRIRRQSSLGNIKVVDFRRPPTSTMYFNHQRLTSSTPVRTVVNGSSTDLKKLVYSYFGDEKKLAIEEEVDRLASSDEYRICGKRKTLDGRVQYLIEWIKCTNPL